MGRIELGNGEGTYTFTTVDKEIVLKILKGIETVKYFEDTFHQNGKKLEVVPNNEVHMLAEKENLIFDDLFYNFIAIGFVLHFYKEFF